MTADEADVLWCKILLLSPILTEFGEDVAEDIADHAPGERYPSYSAFASSRMRSALLKHGIDMDVVGLKAVVKASRRLRCKTSDSAR